MHLDRWLPPPFLPPLFFIFKAPPDISPLGLAALYSALASWPVDKLFPVRSGDAIRPAFLSWCCPPLFPAPTLTSHPHSRLSQLLDLARSLIPAPSFAARYASSPEPLITALRKAFSDAPHGGGANVAALGTGARLLSNVMGSAALASAVALRPELREGWIESLTPPCLAASAQARPRWPYRNLTELLERCLAILAARRYCPSLFVCVLFVLPAQAASGSATPPPPGLKTLPLGFATVRQPLLLVAKFLPLCAPPVPPLSLAPAPPLFFLRDSVNFARRAQVLLNFSAATSASLAGKDAGDAVAAGMQVRGARVADGGGPFTSPSINAPVHFPPAPCVDPFERLGIPPGACRPRGRWRKRSSWAGVRFGSEPSA